MDTMALERALQALALSTAAMQAHTQIVTYLLCVLTAITLVGFWWIGRDLRATHLLLREVLRRTPDHD
jgi:hypothetical protein